MIYDHNKSFKYIFSIFQTIFYLFVYIGFARHIDYQNTKTQSRTTTKKKKKLVSMGNVFCANFRITIIQ